MTIRQSTIDHMNALARDPRKAEREFAEAMASIFCPNAPRPMPEPPQPEQEAEA